MKSDAKILLVGGCGFIGTNLIPLLNEAGYENITVLDNETVGKREYLDGMKYAEFIFGDIRDADVVDQVMKGQDLVVLLAAQTNVIKSIEDPVNDADLNIVGGLNVLTAAKKHGVERFVFCSSSAPVGMQPPPMREDLPPRPASPYGASKLAMEGYCSAFFHSYGLKSIALRFSNCYGPGSKNKSSVVAHFMKLIMDDEPVIVYGDGEQTRDFIYVKDLCQAIFLAITHDTSGIPDEDVFGRVYQVATGTETSINDLLSKMDGVVRPTIGKDINVEFKDARAGEIVRNYADPSLFKKNFGLNPDMDLVEGMQITWDYFAGERGNGGS